MKFKDLLYSPNEEIFSILSESAINQIAKDVIGRKLSQEELEYLRAKTYTEIENLIIKIGNSTKGQIKDILNELTNES